MNSIFLSIDYKLSKDSSMVAVDSQISDPPFGSSYFRGIDDETLGR